MLNRRVVALDIGGAHLKICGADGECDTVPFALWRQPERLGTQLLETLQLYAPIEALAVTMTGELCDCFTTKCEGVRRIVASVETALDHLAGSARPLVQIWRTDGSWATADEALADPLPCAAANWHALATFAAARVAPETALLIDVGSTTVDLVALVDGRPAAQGRTDTERLLAGELVYSGIRRTPLAAVVRELPYRGRSCPVAAEAFAATQDAYVVLGEIVEDIEATDTADGRPLTRPYSCARLARMICSDSDAFDLADGVAAARHVATTQRRQIADAARRVLARVGHRIGVAVLSGSGEAVGRAVATALDLEPRPLIESADGRVSGAATAFALQVLLTQRVESLA
jgi:probable H4MPT-linked C1 transfer pathway protein